MPSRSNSAQSDYYGDDYDYKVGSPHLRHTKLGIALTSQALSALKASMIDPKQQVVLEIGAGDGVFSRVLLDEGFSVVATEMSAASAERLANRFGRETRFEVVHDPDGTLSSLSGRKFDGIFFASVLHHIPDYMGAIRQVVGTHLETGGALVSIQDSLWYPRLGRLSRAGSELSYLTWRVTQGNLRQGLSTRMRRIGKGVGETHEAVLVEFHVVGDGVDE